MVAYVSTETQTCKQEYGSAQSFPQNSPIPSQAFIIEVLYITCLYISNVVFTFCAYINIQFPFPVLSVNIISSLRSAAMQ